MQLFWLRLALVLGCVSAPFAVITPMASAVPCADVEVVFARGTFEPPGIGATGQAFVDALTAQSGGRTVKVYPVEYPASLDFMTASVGVIDASTRIKDVAASCPSTVIVLGGCSQGAAVMGYVTADSVPADYLLPPGLTGPLDPEVAKHVAAVVLIAKPSSGFLNMIAHSAPPITIGSGYAAKTLELCLPDDPVCSPYGTDYGAHGRYVSDGLTDQGADYVARLAFASGGSSS